MSFAGQDKIVILNLMALFGARNPAIRNNMHFCIDLILKQALSLYVQLNLGKKIDGYEITEDVLKFVESTDEYFINLSCNEFIKMELKIIDTIIEALFHRKWALVVADKGLNFITSDSPVSIIWKNPEKHFKSSPGFASSHSQIFFPLTKNMALIGDFHGRDEVVKADKELVALINSNISATSKNLVYCASEDFYFYNHFDEIIFGASNYINLI